MTRGPDLDNSLPLRLESIRQWSNKTSPGGLTMVTNELVAYMLDMIDNRPTYTPKTTTEQRAAVLDYMIGDADTVRAILEDLHNAEAALGVRS